MKNSDELSVTGPNDKNYLSVPVKEKEHDINVIRNAVRKKIERSVNLRMIIDDHVSRKKVQFDEDSLFELVFSGKGMTDMDE
jgi:hypothetical protein